MPDYTKYKESDQIDALKKICAKIATLDDDWLEGSAEDLLLALTGVLEDQSQDDAWTTEGYEHFFGLE